MPNLLINMRLLLSLFAALHIAKGNFVITVEPRKAEVRMPFLKKRSLP